MNGFNAKQLFDKIYKPDLLSHLKRLDVKTRNKVRAICASDESEAIKILNKLRRDLPVGKLLDVEKAISAFHSTYTILPQLFPDTPQTTEAYKRLDSIPLTKHLSLLNSLVKEHIYKLDSFSNALSELNQLIVGQNFPEATLAIESIVKNFGFSHCLLRKVVLIKELSQDEKQDGYLHELLNQAATDSKIITPSLIHCYQQEQDYLGIKRSIMGLSDNGESNKYTRDLARLPFHAHSKNTKDLEELIQSSLQSSLIDALIIVKVNIRILDLTNYKHINNSISKLESTSPSLEELASLYINDEDSEFSFFKQSSAWLESEKIVNYRYLVDHFFDSPESDYFEITPKLIQRAGEQINSKHVSGLLSGEKLLNEIGELFHEAQQQGAVTRSAIFNYLAYTKTSELEIYEEQLFPLMNQTSALDRTIHVPSIKKILPMLPSQHAKLILWLLIAKKSRNEVDQTSLKSLMEKMLQTKYEGSLVRFIEDISKKSEALAIYLYETCNEDFIARMTRVIKKAGDITETRAALHIWMGEHTGESVYSDRARNLIIDTQINKIRGEIDDNRIYVDTTRFSEWFNDHISSQMGSILLILNHNDGLDTIENPQLFDLIEKCFNEFCTSSFFGISSYLGRRIRHGTFRGHLYSSLINNIEKKYSKILIEAPIDARWLEWKTDYQNKVMEIINDKLHIHSQQKKSGFLLPNLRDPAKSKIALSCISSIIEHFKTVGNIFGIENIIIGACWRVAEVDLKRFNSYIKGQKPHLLKGSLLNNVNNSNLTPGGVKLAREFERELQSLISEKLKTICTWFKKPQSASAKVSLSLLYKAVVSEVQQTFDSFTPDTEFDENDDIELYGGVYHIFYDALYVIIFNAAKHGKPHGNLARNFYLDKGEYTGVLHFRVVSEIKDSDDESYVSQRLQVLPNENISNAQVIENRSGIKKLYNLQSMDEKFKIRIIECENRQVLTEFTYELGY